MRPDLVKHIETLTGGKSKDGTKVAGFVTVAENQPPRECGNCKWMRGEVCIHKVVNSDPELQSRKNEEGVKVSPDECCDFFQNKTEGKPVKITGLAKAIDQAHRAHPVGKHPETLDYQGTTYKLNQ